MKGWAAFAEVAPEFAEAGKRLLVGDDGVAIAFLATADGTGAPHLSPVCPIFAGGDLYLSASGRTPKVRHLRDNGRFALHAFLGESDEEFRVSGVASEVVDPDERSAVHDAIRFAVFDPEDPIFRFWIEAAVWVYWERAGQPDTRAVRRRWPSR